MVYENIITAISADEAIALFVVKPLHCSLFFHLFLFFPASRADCFLLCCTHVLATNCIHAKTKKAAVPSSGAAAKIRYDWYKNLIRQPLLYANFHPNARNKPVSSACERVAQEMASGRHRRNCSLLSAP